MSRTIVLPLLLLAPTSPASAALALSPTNIFAPASTPADSIFELSLFVIAVTAAIFAVVFGLLLYAVVRFRRKADDDAMPSSATDSGCRRRR